jgi:3-dehydroquinate synthase
MEIVNVELGARTYAIYVGAGCLPEIGGRLAATHCGKRVAVVTNTTVAGLYLEPTVAALRAADFDPQVIQMPDGEEHKNLAWLAFVYDKLIDAEIDRGGAVVALGGGVVGDLAGFGAATYLRGITCVQVPTTLVAQVDSSVGGKTGINHAAGKNLIGVFAQPRFVLADVDCLRSLPRRELVAGLAEVIKYGAILDPALFALLETRRPEILRLERDLLIHIVKTSCTLKALVVAEDETEGDYRAVLNFGHTLGHAIESLTEYRQYLHGEAVAIGMVAAARLSNRLDLCEAGVPTRLALLLEKLGLPTELPTDVDTSRVARAVGHDKKAARDAVAFIACSAVGSCREHKLRPADIMAGIGADGAPMGGAS